MVNFYVLQIKLGKITLEDVPMRWQSKVADILDKEKKEQGGD